MLAKKITSLWGNLAWLEHYTVVATQLPKTTSQQSNLGVSTWYYFMLHKCILNEHESCNLATGNTGKGIAL